MGKCPSPLGEWRELLIILMSNCMAQEPLVGWELEDCDHCSTVIESTKSVVTVQKTNQSQYWWVVAIV